MLDLLGPVQFLFLVWMVCGVCDRAISALLTCYKIRTGVYDKELEKDAEKHKTFWYDRFDSEGKKTSNTTG